MPRSRSVRRHKEWNVHVAAFNRPRNRLRVRSSPPVIVNVQGAGADGVAAGVFVDVVVLDGCRQQVFVAVAAPFPVADYADASEILNYCVLFDCGKVVTPGISYGEVNSDTMGVIDDEVSFYSGVRIARVLGVARVDAVVPAGDDVARNFYAVVSRDRDAASQLRCANDVVVQNQGIAAAYVRVNADYGDGSAFEGVASNFGRGILEFYFAGGEDGVLD